MIKKIQSIRNMGVFKNFEWDASVLDRHGDPIKFSKINLIYGRNYSGKTTLSKILRAFQTKHLSSKYGTPEFKLLLEDNAVVSETEISYDIVKARVFNEDFNFKNLKFFSDPNEDIEPFAIVGEGNPEITEKIEKLIDKLGSDENDSRSGLYRDLNGKEGAYRIAVANHKLYVENIENDFKRKSTTGNNSIRNKPELFGDQNYNIAKFKKDADFVFQEEFEPITNLEKESLIKITKESDMEKITIKDLPSFDLEDLKSKTSNYLKKPVGKTKKILALLEDSEINNWVRVGLGLHQSNDVKNCFYCGNLIGDERKDQLKKHFDKESLELRKDIKFLIEKLDTLKDEVSNYKLPLKEKLYSNFQNTFSDLEKIFYDRQKTIIVNIEYLIDLLNKRLDSIFDPIRLEINLESFQDYFDTYQSITILLQENEDFSAQLNTKQSEARKNLRLREVYDYLIEYRYFARLRLSSVLEHKAKVEKGKYERKLSELSQVKLEIQNLENDLNDASIAATEVNRLLNHNLGHSTLQMKALDEDDETVPTKFAILRNGQKAYNLSEGEKSLIAFCYFIASLQDGYDENHKPILWIDDPISSLDSNHIYFVYSLIKTQLINEKVFDQIFITTHNLNFLKYLKRLSSTITETQNPISYFLIERESDGSSINRMPKYLKDSTSEFSHLFKHIQICANQKCTDITYEYYYNFGNNSRKFFEIYLYYRFPNYEEHSGKMKKFFGMDEIPGVLLDRINNESSHIVGNLERGQLPVEIPEIRNAAKLIIEKIKDHDEEQYSALIRSIQKA